MRIKAAAFPQDDRFFWRVDWVGELTFPNPMIRRMQSSALLYLSTLSPTPLDPTDLHPLTFTHAQRKCWVSVGSLNLFRIGDIWRDGHLEAQPDYQVETFNDILINSNTSTLVKAGLNLNDEGFLLPLDEHPWHRQNTQSYCVVVDLPDKRRLIVPCHELIRFYFGSSSGLLSKLFAPTLSRKNLYSDFKFDHLTKHLQITLASKISGYSAADIGRLACDPIAWRAAAMIGASCLKASVNHLPIYPQTFFPFEGTTTLTASGKWLSFSGRPNATFLVYCLRSCSHPFPFKSLRYETTRQARSASGEAAANPIHHGSAQDPKQQTLVEQDASRSLSPKTKQIYENVRFPDLVGKPVWKTKQIHSPDSENFICSPAKTPVDEIAVGDPGSDERIRPVDLVTVFNKPYPKVAQELLQRMVDYFKTMTAVKIQLLTSSDEDGWTIPVPLVGDEDGVIELQPYYTSRRGNKRLKRLAIFEITHSQGKLFAAAIEGLIDDEYADYAALFDNGRNLTYEEVTRKIVRALLFFENDLHDRKFADCKFCLFFIKLQRILESLK